MPQKFSREPFVNFYNKEIINLTSKLEKLDEEKERIEEQQEIISKNIVDIQNKCNHEYLLYFTGTYEDGYKCKHCGKYEWR